MVRVYALDRFSSEGIEAVFDHTAHLKQCGVSFWRYCEPLLNTTGLMASLFKAITAWAAAYRNVRHSENVRLGPARKRAEVEAAGGAYQHGRRPVDELLVTRIHELQHEGLSDHKIAAAAGTSLGTVNKYKYRS